MCLLLFDVLPCKALWCMYSCAVFLSFLICCNPLGSALLMVTLTEKHWKDSDLSSDEDGLPVSRNPGRSGNTTSPPPPPPPPTASAPASPVTLRSRAGTLLPRGR